MQSYSDDDGLTFSPPEVIHNITKPEWTWLGLGPPGGLLLQSNRILVPAYYSTSPAWDLSTAFVMINDFNGQVDKWYFGGQYNLGNYYPNENQAVELLPNNNSIFINARAINTVRIGAYSDDGGLTFNKVKVLNTLADPPTGCEGSIIYHQDTRQIFYTGIADTTARDNLSLYISEDNGDMWRFIKTIWQGPAAYSSLTILPDQSVGVLYEGGNNTPYDSQMFTIVYNATEQRFV